MATMPFIVTATDPEGMKFQVNELFRNLYEEQLKAGALVPVGAYLPWPTETPPIGYLECDGSAVSRTGYAALFAVIGTNHGAGNGATTFNLPDWRGQFLRVWDHGAGIDPDAASRTDRGDGKTGDHNGTEQAYDTKQHLHNVTMNEYGISGANTVDFVGGSPLSCQKYGDASVNVNSGNYPASGGNETRPKNKTAMICIKY